MMVGVAFTGCVDSDDDDDNAAPVIDATDYDGDGVKNEDDPCPIDAEDKCDQATEVKGCIYSSADNYNPDANVDDGSCVYSNEQTIEIAGSSTVFPVASAWAQEFMSNNPNYKINVAGGGSGAGASRICSTDADHVDIGDMSRGWKSSEAAVADNGYIYECLDSEVTATQLQVAIDGLSVVVKRGGGADMCIADMGGLSVAQLRWIYSDWSESDLANHAEGGLDMSSVTPSNDNDGVREWSDLSDSPNCADSAVKLWGADSDSGTYEYFGETVLCKNCFAGKSGYPAEGFDDSRDGGYQNSADDNVIVNGVYGDDNAIGYFGYAYYEENADKLNVVSISPDEVGGGNDDHVTPSAGTVGSGQYSPLARPIFMNVDNTQWSLVSSFLQFGFSAQGAELVAEVGYVPIPGYLVAEMSRRIAEAGSHGGKIAPDCSGANFDIAGSSTVFPVASAWAQEYMERCSGKDITIAGGGSGAGASRMCSTDSDHVQIGDMSRGWKSSEAAVSEDGYTYDCLDSEVSATQLQVAIDGLSVVVKRGGDADKCIAAMGGLSVAQLRWIYSDWSESDLANHAEGGLDMSSVTPSNDNDGVREWSDLSDSADCADSAIKLWGADSDSGTYEYFGETVFCKNCFAGKSGYDSEGFDNSRDGGYQNSADDNVIVEGVSGDGMAIGYFGYAYYEENAAVLNVVAISGDEVGGGSTDYPYVTPSSETVASGEYAPLARPIFMNVDNSAWDLVLPFMQYGFYKHVGSDLVAEVGYVALTGDNLATMKHRIETASAQIQT
jgi:phosphate transport system substrate-binding protein